MNKKTILALGADIKNRLLIANDKFLRFGPDIGDLSDTRNFEAFKKAVQKATRELKPDIIAHDLHPNYFSTQFAKSKSPYRMSQITCPIQHHHAHIASVMQEYSLKKPVIGVSFDGTGFGTDRNIWGGEFLLTNRRGFKRLAHLKYNKMPGGEKVIREPWRMVLSILGRKGFPFIKNAKKEDKELILSMISKDINSPLTSSAGRLFDAAAALLGICEYASCEAEGPIKLEALCQNGIQESYDFDILKQNNQYIVDATPLFLSMAKDLKRQENKRIIATKFHNSIADIITKTIKKLSKDTGVKNIALSGGVFQNKFLTRKTIKKLLLSKLNVFINNRTPVNDFNISLGQYYVSCNTSKS